MSVPLTQALDPNFMDQVRRIALWVFAASILASLGASLLHERTAAVWLGAPALLLSAWAFFGHLVTLDDEFPGGWSNPDSQRSVLLTSLTWLAVEAVVFAAALWLVLAWPL